MTTPPQPPPAPPPPPAGGAPPPGYANDDEKTWALVAHFGGAGGMFILSGLGGWIAPLIAYLGKGKESPTVRQHALNALNFQLTWTFLGVLGWLTICFGIGVVFLMAAAIVGAIFGVLAGLKANEGQLYQYPVSLKLIK